MMVLYLLVLIVQCVACEETNLPFFWPGAVWSHSGGGFREARDKMQLVTAAEETLFVQ